MKSNGKPIGQRFKDNSIKIGQFIFLTTKFFMNNRLTTYASACSLGFLFSFIPIIVIIMVVLISIFHTSPDIIFRFIDLPAIFVEPEKIEEIAVNITSPGKVSILTSILIISIFWMGQRFFFSVENGIKTIFHLGNTIKRKPAIETILLIIGEIVGAVAIAVLLFIFMTAKAVFSQDLFVSKIAVRYFPRFITFLKSTIFLDLLPYVFVCILSAVMYKFASGSKPSWLLCFLSSAIGTLVFHLITILLGMFMNTARYNLVYGVLSNLIILLLEVYIFFVLFFISAQGIFTYQFFESLLLSELYLRKQSGSFKFITGCLFSEPNQLISEENPRLTFEENSIIYEENSNSDGIYYMVSGKVKLFRSNFEDNAKAGDFFGDYDCISGQKHTFSVQVLEETTVIFINKRQFSQLIESNPEVSQKIIENMSHYISRVYANNQIGK